MGIRSDLDSVEAQIEAAHDDGMGERLAGLWKKHEAILLFAKGQDSPGIIEILRSCIDTTWRIEQEALPRKDWDTVNRASKNRLDFAFQIAAVLRDEASRDDAQEALADRLELVEQLEAHLPGLKEREWGLYMRARHFEKLFR